MNIEDTLKKLINKASKKNEIPVACIITKDNKIVSKAYNKKNKSNKVIDHAEIIAICKLSKKIKSWNLSGYNLYCTLKPCKMCEEIIKQSYIDNVYYVLDNDKVINYHYNSNKISSENYDFYEKKLKEFFITKR